MNVVNVLNISLMNISNTNLVNILPPLNCTL